MNFRSLFVDKDKLVMVNMELAIALNSLDEAIVLNQLNYWIERNKDANRNFHDGNYWVYNSYESWKKQDFPVWSATKIKRIFTSLESKGIILSANYNKLAIDKTKWYTIDYEKLKAFIKEYSIGQNEIRKGQNEASKDHNDKSTGQNDQTLDRIDAPLPDTTTDTTSRDYTNNSLSDERASESEPVQTKRQNRKKEANELFERVWKLYPKKIGKGQVSSKQKSRLLDIGYDELERAVHRCCEYNKEKDKQYWQNGSTFFNNGYIDFLDENYQDCNSFDSAGLKEIKKEPLSEKERVRLGIEKARQEFGEEYGEKYWEGMDDGKIEAMLRFIGIDVDNL